MKKILKISLMFISFMSGVSRAGLCDQNQKIEYDRTIDLIIHSLNMAENVSISSCEELETYTKNISSLTLIWRGYEQIDLGPLIYFSNLIELNLYSQRIGSFSALSNLKKLEYLNMTDVYVSEISWLSSLTNLKSLKFSLMPSVQDFSLIAKLAKLHELYLYDGKIEDLSFIGGLNRLRSLILVNNDIEEIKISLPSSLEYLNISKNNLKNLNFLKTSSSLALLYADQNEINDLSILKNLKNLEFVSLKYNQIDDISALGDANLGKGNSLYSLSPYLIGNPIDVNDFDESKCPTSGVASKVVMDYCSSKKLAP